RYDENSDDTEQHCAVIVEVRRPDRKLRIEEVGGEQNDQQRPGGRAHASPVALAALVNVEEYAAGLRGATFERFGGLTFLARFLALVALIIVALIARVARIVCVAARE